MRWITLATLLMTSLSHAGEVAIVRNEHTLKITIDDEVFSVYNLGHDYAKPFMYPVAAPGALEQLVAAGHGEVFVAQEQAPLKRGGTAEYGSILSIEKVELPWLKIAGQDDAIHQHDVIPVSGFITRKIESEASKEYDHIHHKGIWMSIDEVNDIRYWAEKGVIRNSEVAVDQAAGDRVTFNVTNHWLGAVGEPLLIEATRITVFADRLLSYDTTFTAVGESVTFDDTKEGLFGIRLPNAMREAVANAPVVGSNGEVGSKLLWGKSMDWIDYTGPVDGRLCGVTVMDHPDNFRPSRYHVRDYGLFSISPFGESSYTNGAQAAAPYTIEKDGTLRLRYGLYVHAGDTDSAHVADAFRQFVDATRP
ncbi:MAG: PmoA family protein [Planctomycetaceae bacterium]|nr:PmoA family protein [Planctomycetaceae bacterium]